MKYVQKYWLCIKVGRGHRKACVGTWGRETRDLRTTSMGRGDVWDGDAGDAGTIMIIEKVGGKCDISHFPREYVLVKATHPALLRVPPCLFTKLRRSSALKKVKPLSLSSCRITAFDSK